MSKSIEHLLTPRYKVIDKYPGSKTAIGTIFYKHIFPETGNYCYVTDKEAIISGEHLMPDDIEGYPHLFRKLEWWEERTEEEMPEYVRCEDKVRRFKKIHKYRDPNMDEAVELFDLPGEIEYEEYVSEGTKAKGYELYDIYDCTPATKEEYDNQFINKAK